MFATGKGKGENALGGSFYISAEEGRAVAPIDPAQGSCENSARFAGRLLTGKKENL